MRCPLSDGLGRRDFIHKATLGVAGAGALLAGCTKRPDEEVGQAQPPPTAPEASVSAEPTDASQPAPVSAAPPGDDSRVIIARHSGATVNGAVQEEPVAKMVERAVMELSGEDSAQAAWQKFVSADEVIGIKVNGLGGLGMATSALLTKACVESLQGIGVKPENIIIWDSNTDYLINCGLTEGTMWGAQVVTMDVGWDTIVEQGSFRGPITSIVMKRVDGYINLPIMKDHGTAGVTLAMKNHYGSCRNPGDHHANNCDPYIADLNTIPAIRDKQRLILCDGTRCQAHRGPSYKPQYATNPNVILAATNCVAHDTVGWEFIEGQRKELGLEPIYGGDQPPQLKSATERGLGTNDLSRIEKVEVTVA